MILFAFFICLYMGESLTIMLLLLFLFVCHHSQPFADGLFLLYEFMAFNGLYYRISSALIVYKISRKITIN